MKAGKNNEQAVSSGAGAVAGAGAGDLPGSGTAGELQRHLRALVAAAPAIPGVYRFLDEKKQVLYVGKAAKLRHRLRSYMQPMEKMSIKTRKLMEQVRDIETTVCDTANEALILENNLIKSLSPRYNILFRDDKSYPFIRLDRDHGFPGLFFSHKSGNPKQRYFGPYADTRSVRRTLSLLQKLFRIRNCSANFFKNRTRPCLQHHLKRCSAPCTGEISPSDYAEDLRGAVLFLEGRGKDATNSLMDSMQLAADSRNYELAGKYRDMISEVRSVQHQYRIMRPGTQWDAVACCTDGNMVCVQVFSVRDGVNLGNRSYMQKRGQGASEDLSEVLAAFLARHYLNPEFVGNSVDEILLNQPLEDPDGLRQAISTHIGGKVLLRSGELRDSRKKLLQQAVDNAMQYMRQKNTISSGENGRKSGNMLQALGKSLQIQGLLHAECFDISHTGGTNTTASCVVFANSGPVRSEYRRFNIEGVTAGDDYAAMAQAVRRRYGRLLQANAGLPQLTLIDGGKGQVRAAHEVLLELGCADRIRLVGVVKAPGRKSGEESMVDVSGQKLDLPGDPEVWRPLLQLRDEAHRFALTGHRKRRGKVQSVLDTVPGVGQARRRLLLTHFGGLQGLREATRKQLQAVPGIGNSLAESLYRKLHP